MKSPHNNKVTGQNGFTLIEVLVVIVIIGSLMAFGMQLLKAVSISQSEVSERIQIEKIFEDGRKSALQNGKIYTLELNFDLKTMGLLLFSAKHEASLDTLESTEFIKLDQRAQLEDDMRNKEDSDKEAEEEIEYIVGPTNMPKNLNKVYSISGIEIKSAIINIHFYPNGSSDSIIFYFKGKSKPYLYLPRQNTRPRYLFKLKLNENS